ncbi:MAG: hexitol phosphatase HxpB [Bacteroidales bacterium]
MKSIQAVIFDLDGLLIDSEPLWELAEQAVFARYGITVTHEICQQVKGLRVDESVHVILGLFSRSDLDPVVIARQIQDKVIRLIAEKGKGMPGYVYILHFFRSRGIKIALASSSKMEVIRAALQKLGISHHFEFIHSAEYEKFGKPHPGIFLSVAQKWKIPPEQCLVFEDSLNGVIAARAARMRVVAIPEPSLQNDPRFTIANLVLPSLLHFKEHHLNELLSK